MRSGFFSLSVAAMLTHEIDAAYRHEWRILPILSDLPDDLGRDIFILAHVPLIFALLHLGWHDSRVVKDRTRMIFAAFCIVHVGLQIWFAAVPGNEFGNWLSQSLIWGAGFTGLLYLAAASKAR